MEFNNYNLTIYFRHKKTSKIFILKVIKELMNLIIFQMKNYRIIIVLCGKNMELLVLRNKF